MVISHEVVGSHEVAGIYDIKIFIWPNGIDSGCFEFNLLQNVAKSMLSLISQFCGDSLLAVCLSRQDGAIYRSPEHLQMCLIFRGC